MAYHIYHDTPQGRLPFTYFVFGPYAGEEYDVEIWRGHIELDQRTPDANDPDYLGTVSSLTRKTHIVVDVWDQMDVFVGAAAVTAT